MFLCAFLSICLSIFWCLDYSRTNEQIFIKHFVGGTWSKEEVTNFWKDLDRILDTKNHEFSFFIFKVPFQCILMILAFYLIFVQK